MKQRILSIFAALWLIAGSAMAQGLLTPELNVVLKEIKAGENTMLRLNILGLDRMSAMQFNLSLPEGFELDGDIVLRDATTDHTLYANTLASGDLFVVLYSLDQNTFSNGYILNIPVAVAKNAVSSEAHIYNIRTATVKAVSHTLSDVTFALDVAAVEPEPEPEPEAPKVENGEYYLYNVSEKKFLSRGEHWGTCATIDKYGVPFVWTAEEYSLKFLDSNVHLFETDDSNLYTDNASTGFAFEYTEGGYLLKSQKSDRYLTIVDKAYTHQIVNVTDDATAATLWQPMTKAEHDAFVAGYVEENYASVIEASGISATAGDFANYLATLTAVDVTDAIGTARFGGNAGEWTFTEVRHQDWQPAYGTDFCELWQATGHYTQTITGLAEGIYKVTMQGFERAGGWAVCKDLGDKGYEITTATLSANGEEVNLKSWYSEKSGDNNPNNTGEAVAKFDEGKYMNEVYTYVADGTLTLMVNKPSHVGDNWMLFNNFTLTLYTTDTGIEETTVNGQQTTVIYDLLGRKVTDTEHLKGIYIVGGRKVVIK